MATDTNVSQPETIAIGDMLVNRLGYGAMRITGNGIWGEPDDMEMARSVLKRAVALGVNFIDTADAYGPEVSENLISQALYPYDGLLIATKGGLTRSGPGIWTPDCSPKHLREALDASLLRLKVDQIDLYQLHAVDPNVAFADSYKTLLELQQAGKIRNIGLSNITAKEFHEALKMGKFVSVQNKYNITDRTHEDILQLCEEQSIAFIPYFPIGGNQDGGVAAAVLSEIATAHRVSERQVALAWLLAHSPVMVPIPGTASIDHLEENVAAVQLKLTNEDLERLDSIA